MKKRLASLGFALILCVSICIPSFAANETSGKCGDNVNWSLNRSTGVLTISGKGAMYDFKAPEQFQNDPRPWYAYWSEITSVVVQDGVSRIGNLAFSESFINLKRLVMDDSVSSIGIAAFSQSGLEDVVLSQKLKSIENRAFTDCTNLKRINLPDSLTSIGKDCFMDTGLSEVRIPKNVTVIGEFALGFKGGVTQPVPNFLIYGYAGSTAEQYAKSYTYEALFNKWVFDTYSPDYFYRLHPEYYGKSGQIFRFVAISEKKSDFDDVHENDWFAEPVEWAIKNDITNGTGNNMFSPNATCTTAQILTFLWRTAGSKEPTLPNPFSNVKTSDYYYKPALWAYENGLVSGKTFFGDTPCTRAVTVTYFWKLSGGPTFTAIGNFFADVPANASYANAVEWAVAQNITSGTGNNQFSPDITCTRGQIVTFLYRWKDGSSESTATNVKVYTDAELCNMVKAYYKATYGATPPIVEVAEAKGNSVTILLGETANGKFTAWDWYTVDRTTARGTDALSNTIDLSSFAR